MRNIVIFTVLALVISGMATRLAEKFGNDGEAQRARPAATQKTVPSNTGTSTLAVASDRTGHFRVNANVGGRSLELLVDTGASVVALTKRDADRLGLNPAPRDYTVRIQTANGTVNAAQVRLASMEVGSLTMRDVPAVILPEGALSQNLLGMSFLSRLRRFEFRGSQLVMEQ